jgi:hypothetical protein
LLLCLPPFFAHLIVSVPSTTVVSARTWLRPALESIIAGVETPTMALSSTVAKPSITSPLQGIVSPLLTVIILPADELHVEGEVQEGCGSIDNFGDSFGEGFDEDLERILLRRLNSLFVMIVSRVTRSTEAKPRHNRSKRLVVRNICSRQLVRFGVVMSSAGF